VKVATQFGVVHLPRQVCYHARLDKHVMPGNEALPEHEGMIITRGLQEWACLLPQTLPFETAARLLSWQTQEERILSATTLRTLVRTHGQAIREAEEAEVKALLEREDLDGLQLRLVPAETPRHQPGWPAALNEAVEAALREESGPPKGVSQADWERVLAARREEKGLSVEVLRQIGPEVQEDEVVVTPDEVLTRRQEKRRFWELRTARVTMATGYRYISGTGEGFLRLLLLVVLLGVGKYKRLVVIADGARWIRNWFQEMLGRVPHGQFILDWYHVRKKCYEMSSMICRGRKARAQLVGRLYHRLWHGDVQGAIACLEGYLDQAKNEEALDSLISYLSQREAYIPDYAQRHRERRYIGSGHGEKANDLIVARRQKRKGMHWSLTTSNALAALQTLMLNRDWEGYWSHRQLPSLVAT